MPDLHVQCRHHEQCNDTTWQRKAPDLYMTRAPFVKTTHFSPRSYRALLCSHVACLHACAYILSNCITLLTCNTCGLHLQYAMQQPAYPQQQAAPQHQVPYPSQPMYPHTAPAYPAYPPAAPAPSYYVAPAHAYAQPQMHEPPAQAPQSAAQAAMMAAIKVCRNAELSLGRSQAPIKSIRPIFPLGSPLRLPFVPQQPLLAALLG